MFVRCYKCLAKGLKSYVLQNGLNEDTKHTGPNL